MDTIKVFGISNQNKIQERNYNKNKYNKIILQIIYKRNELD